jgi:hypothetical protein
MGGMGKGRAWAKAMRAILLHLMTHLILVLPVCRLLLLLTPLSTSAPSRTFPSTSANHALDLKSKKFTPFRHERRIRVALLSSLARRFKIRIDNMGDA